MNDFQLWVGPSDGFQANPDSNLEVIHGKLVTKEAKGVARAPGDQIFAKFLYWRKILWTTLYCLVYFTYPSNCRKTG
jgi:hypothetical protein